MPVKVKTKTTPDQQEARAKEEGWGYDGSMATELEVLHLLTALVFTTKPEVCVETGTFGGHGTVAIQGALMANGKGHLWTVENQPALAEHYAGIEMERVTFVNADSIDWTGKGCPQRVDFAWVDCCEDPAGRVTVFSQLLPRITEGGLICVHDHQFYRDEDYMDKLIVLAGKPNLTLDALNGFACWKR